MNNILDQPAISGLIDALVMRTNLGRGYFEQAITLSYDMGVIDGRRREVEQAITELKGENDEPSN